MIVLQFFFDSWKHYFQAMFTLIVLCDFFVYVLNAYAKQGKDGKE